MAERDLIVDKLRIHYEGLFSVRELYRIIDQFFDDRNYDKREIKNVEIVRPEGKYIELELEPWKSYSDYYRNIIHVRIIITDLKDVEVKKKNIKKRLNHGVLTILIDGYIETDYEQKWEYSPILFLIRTVFNKYVFKPFTKSYGGSVVNDVEALYETIRRYLNMQRADSSM